MNVQLGLGQIKLVRDANVSKSVFVGHGEMGVNVLVAKNHF